MSDFKNIDVLLNESAGWAAKRSQYLIDNPFPAKKQWKKEGITISYNRKNSQIKKIIDLVANGKVAEARKEAQNKFQEEIINHLELTGGADEPFFVRKINKGHKGDNSPIMILCNYDSSGNPIIAEVSKDEVYCIEGRKFRGRLAGLLPSPSKPYVAPMKEELPPKEVVEEENAAPAIEPQHIETSQPGDAADAIIADNSANSSTDPVSIPSNGDSPAGGGPVKVSTKSDLLRRLLGNKLVNDLDKLDILDKVTIEKDISIDSIAIYNGRDGSPYRLDGMEGVNVQSSIPFKALISSSSFADADAPEAAKPYRADDIGNVLLNIFQPKLLYANQKGGRQDSLATLRYIRKHMASLSTVFGFDDPAQLEAFFAAWLMKDSTCRLTGIPGTGKTTVINAAATLMSNSYGFNTTARYVAATPLNHGDKHKPFIFPNGQEYNVNYGNKAFESERGEWESWRFNEWAATSNYSGAYIYDFRFLQQVSDSNVQKLPMKPSAFKEILLGCEVIEMENTQKLLTQTMVRALKIKSASISSWFGGKTVPASITIDGDSVKYNGKVLWSDSGANEGYYLREFMLEHFYDARLDDGERGLDNIGNEMLMETGIAKVDYDKRAEEILYGIEIRQVTTKDRVSGDTVASYEFEPTPRPIVTQPIKFFNEANRSGSGVEDAILGLIAEKTVEYRGRTFTSPSFIAWMDTNPHQKGNDLAFVDRIDMELYLGSLSLGSRFATLNERFGRNKATSGSGPQLQLITRMLMTSNSKDFLKPMRFNELTKVWKGVGGLPFNPQGISDENGGALLDISLLSVLFTQRYMAKAETVEVYGGVHTYSYDNDVYASPLVDISTTTNLQYESQHKDEILKFGTGEEGQSSQAPVLIKRMLGFRFTNSLVKMTRALSFLRGKEYVTRQEVVDALPYCVGHRLGPAREGEDPKGRDIGIVREGMTVTNEQAFIRQLIVHGYLLRDTPSLMAGYVEGMPSMFDIWDAFLNTCISKINMGEPYWHYEDEVLIPLKARVRAGGDITPVHWHIGTMVTENIRRSEILQKDGFTYKQRYTRYLESLSSPKSLYATSRFSTKDEIEDMTSNHAAVEYYKIRGMIARDDLLFSNDRETLLTLCESKIKSLTGGSLSIATADIPSSSLAVNKSYSTQPRSGPQATQFKWQNYGDALGIWGRLISGGTNDNIGVTELGDGDNALDVAGVGLKANQLFSKTGIFQVGAKEQTNQSFFRGISKAIEFITPYVLGSGQLLGDLTKPSKEGSLFGPLSAVTPNEYGLNAKDLVYRWLRGEGSLGLDDGYMACFKMRHFGEASQNNFKDITGGDDLRLWFRMRVVEGTQSEQSATLAFYIGVTSATMMPIKTDINDNPVAWAILDFNDAETYSATRYSDMAVWLEKKYEDCGNITADDVRFFSENIMKALHS
tara:strand:+ start:1111 stop:5346 length:4236 start_codon:yes stop_codon:yes gene_type:complete